MRELVGAMSSLDLCLAWNVLPVPETTLKKKLHVGYNSRCWELKKYIDGTILYPSLLKIINMMSDK